MAPLSELWQRATSPDSSWTNVARTVALWLVAATVPVVAVVAWTARLNSFPDEALHVTTASFYLEHWLPPPISAELAPYAGVHGVSYFMLWPPQAAYFLFAKASLLTFVGEDARWLIYRALCVALWSLLVAHGLRASIRAPWSILLIGLTPQVWYLFTYFSADAFSYTVAAVLALQLGTPDSCSRRFLQTGAPRIGGVVLGVCFGGLALSKMNYMPFALFAVVYVSVLAWRTRATSPVWRSVGIVATSAVLVATPFLGVDVVNNGIARGDRFEQLREELAAPSFKPSAIAGGTAYRGLGLRQRGVSARALLSRPWRWGELTYRSFFGVYGTMNIFSPKHLNGAQALSAIALLGLAWRQRRRSPFPGRPVLLVVATTMIVASIGAAFWRAWDFDFQAQGRYIFAVIPITALLLMDTDERRAGALHWALFCVLTVLGMISIVSALPELT